VTPTDIAAWSGVTMSFVSLLSMFYFAGVKMATLSVKVDTMWSFTMKRAISEAVNNDLMKLNSPIEITSKGFSYIQPMAQELWDYYQNKLGKLSDEDLALDLERNFGERLLKEVCIPNDMLYGECVMLAVEAVRKHGDLL